MSTFIAVFALFLLALAGLGLSLLVKGQALKGTCASQSAFTGGSCDVCGKTAGDVCGQPPSH
ncbi:hypothetical protein [Sinimarinibacterium sp. NLF-5-8]|uniref:hypothetical protein n=1 Tax=Sinimarinibacterium sp. NLF-5-8 TaxID=2698684 RepID=UPI00137B9DE1|nr:hypothetical protein [Sinimarinibacterium sp. NLF-5-8]QHS10085.1 hypothetical protein GT972_07980 [Sinimarinibacterium sp. NLF-5-8]